MPGGSATAGALSSCTDFHLEHTIAEKKSGDVLNIGHIGLLFFSILYYGVFCTRSPFSGEFGRWGTRNFEAYPN